MPTWRVIGLEIVEFVQMAVFNIVVLYIFVEADGFTP